MDAGYAVLDFVVFLYRELSLAVVSMTCGSLVFFRGLFLIFVMGNLGYF